MTMFRRVFIGAMALLGVPKLRRKPSFVAHIRGKDLPSGIRQVPYYFIGTTNGNFDIVSKISGDPIEIVCEEESES